MAGRVGWSTSSWADRGGTLTLFYCTVTTEEQVFIREVAMLWQYYGKLFSVLFDVAIYFFESVILMKSLFCTKPFYYKKILQTKLKTILFSSEANILNGPPLGPYTIQLTVKFKVGLHIVLLPKLKNINYVLWKYFVFFTETPVYFGILSTQLYDFFIC